MFKTNFKKKQNSILNSFNKMIKELTELTKELQSSIASNNAHITNLLKEVSEKESENVELVNLQKKNEEVIKNINSLIGKE